MPLITQDNYLPPWWLLNGHYDTIYPAVFRKVEIFSLPQKVTIKTPDQDSFDLNYYDNNSEKTVIISHGLEGNNKRPYVLGMGKAFFMHGWNVIAWSYRGCNGKVNNTIKSYHSGFTEDLCEVIDFAAKPDHVKSLALVGFSLGGNMTLRYLGGEKVATKVKVAVTISVPVDLHQSCLEISKPSNIIYARRFLKTLKQKVIDKAAIFPEIQTQQLAKIWDLKTFDDMYTAPLHGFQDALDYYHSCSAINILDQIAIPALILNAINDPFLPASCYPQHLLKNHQHVYLQTPRRGGHVGFYANNNSLYWSEKRALEFANEMI
jgi:predicted alpha/beta-fold hydrolase